MKDTRQSLDDLDNSLLRYQSVSEITNPVSAAFDGYSPDGKLYILMQYSLFSRYIVRFLTEVLYRTGVTGHHLIAAEMQTNISEELGVGGRGLPHYVLLINAYRESIHLDFYEVEASEATHRFEENMLAGIHGGDGAFASGVAYALESSAVPELRMTLSFVERLFRDLGKCVPLDIQHFFSSHVGDIEVVHQFRLREATIESFRTEEEFTSFGDGFDMALTCMDSWWTNLALEAEMVVERQLAKLLE